MGTEYESREYELGEFVHELVNSLFSELLLLQELLSPLFSGPHDSLLTTRSHHHQLAALFFAAVAFTFANIAAGEPGSGSCCVFCSFRWCRVDSKSPTKIPKTKGTPTAYPAFTDKSQRRKCRSTGSVFCNAKTKANNSTINAIIMRPVITNSSA